MFHNLSEAVMALAALVSAVFAGVLAWFTRSLIVVGRAQHKAASDQHRAAIDALTLAREEFVATHRPKIRVRVVRNAALIDDDSWSIYMVLVNVGINPALIKRLAINTGYRRRNTREWDSTNAHPERFLEEISLSSGQRHERFIYTSLTRSDMLLKIKSEAIELCAFGEIVYTDANGTVRTTGFIWIWDQYTQNFVRSDEPEFSYED